MFVYFLSRARTHVGILLMGRVFNILMNHHLFLLLFGCALLRTCILSVDIFSYAAFIFDHELVDGFERKLRLGLCN